jgi:hypothetical protein
MVLIKIIVAKGDMSICCDGLIMDKKCWVPTHVRGENNNLTRVEFVLSWCWDRQCHEAIFQCQRQDASICLNVGKATSQ